MVDQGFIKGSTDNLPYLDVDMIDEFYRTKVTHHVEIKHSKIER